MLFRRFSTGRTCRFVANMGELSIDMLGSRGSRTAEVRRRFDDIGGERSPKSLPETLDALLKELSPEYGNVSPTRLRLVLIKTELNKTYNSVKEKRSDLFKGVHVVPLDRETARFCKVLNDPRMWRGRKAASSYKELQKRYLKCFMPGILGSLRSHDFELLLRRVVDAKASTQMLRPLALKLLDDVNKSGLKLTQHELFKLVLLGSKPLDGAEDAGDQQRMKLYKQFCSSEAAVKPETGFYLAFLSGFSGRQDAQRVVLEDMIDAALVPTRVDAMRLLAHATHTGDHYLGLETVEYLLSRFHVSEGTVRGTVQFLQAVGEDEFARDIIRKTREMESAEPSAEGTDVQLVDYLLERLQRPNRGWVYTMGRGLAGIETKVDAKEKVNAKAKDELTQESANELDKPEVVAPQAETPFAHIT